MLLLKWSFARPATTCESVQRPNPMVLWPEGNLWVHINWVWGPVRPSRPFGLVYAAERPFRPKLGFCTRLTKPAIATRVLYEKLSYFLWFIGTLWVIDSTSKDFWLYYKIVTFGLEKEKPGIQNMSHAGALGAPGPRWGENTLKN